MCLAVIDVSVRDTEFLDKGIFAMVLVFGVVLSCGDIFSGRITVDEPTQHWFER